MENRQTVRRYFSTAASKVESMFILYHNNDTWFGVMRLFFI